MKSVRQSIFCISIVLATTASAYAAEDSPLIEAAKNHDKAAIEALLAKGADVNVISKSGLTLLSWANKEVAELLLAKGLDVTAKDNTMGQTPLHHIVGSGVGKKDIAELLLANGADINAKDKYGSTPLHSAVNARREDMVKLLLANGAELNAKNMYERTPLLEAVKLGSKGVIELLLGNGADVNVSDKNGRAPLSWAVSTGGQKELVELLLANGADVNAKDNMGFTALNSPTTEQGYVAQLKEHLTKQARLLVDQIKNNPRAALMQLTPRLKGNPADDSTRRLIIKLGSELKPALAIPEEARKHFVEGTAIVKAAKSPAQQTLAAQSFTEALKVAPWWGDAYYNLGVAQELAEQYNEAEQAFSFYLLSNPGATEKREVQDRIYGLSAKRKLAGAK